MKMNEGFGVCYNTQTAVDIGSHLIAGFEVTDSPTDHGQITSLAKREKEDFEGFKNSGDENQGEIIESIAGNGYQDTEGIAQALGEGIIANVIPQSGTKCEIEYDYEPYEITRGIRNSAKPEDLRKCLKAGAVPEAYYGKLVKSVLYWAHQNKQEASHVRNSIRGIDPNGDRA